MRFLSVVALAHATLLCPEDFFFSVFSVAKKKLNTEVAETLRALCVGFFEAQRPPRSSFWLRRSRAEPISGILQGRI
jgi:hypothetical protein